MKNRFRSYILATAALSILICFMLLASTHEGQAQGKKIDDVFVVNTSSNAIPTAAQGTTNIAGSVSVTNTPTVNLASGASVGINGTASVEVANTAANPLPLVNVNDARQPFQTRLTFNIDPGSTQNEAGFDVPAGKRLVIEHASARVQGPAGQQFVAQIQTRVFPNGSATGVHWLVLTHQGTFSGIDVFTSNHDMRVYAEPSVPNTRYIVTRTDLTGTAFAEATISGYLVNL